MPDNAKSFAIQGLTGTGLVGLGTLAYRRGFSLRSHQTLVVQLAHQLASQPVLKCEPVDIHEAVKTSKGSIFDLVDPLKGKPLKAARRDPTGFFAERFKEHKDAHLARSAWLYKSENKIGLEIARPFDLPDLNATITKTERLAALKDGQINGIYSRSHTMLGDSFHRIEFEDDYRPYDLKTALGKSDFDTRFPTHDIFAELQTDMPVHVSKTPSHITSSTISNTIETFKEDVAELQRADPQWKPFLSIDEAFDMPADAKAHLSVVSDAIDKMKLKTKKCLE